MRRYSWLLMTMAVPVLTISGQGVSPTAAVVATRAQAVHLDASRSVKTSLPGRVVTFTPVNDSDLPPDLPTLEKGAVVGVIAIAGSEGGLPSGQYNVFVTRTAAGWEGALERSGKIATISRAVSVAAYPIEHGIPKPMISVGGAAPDDNDNVNAVAPISFASYSPSRDMRTAKKDSVTITVHIHGWTITLKVDL
jgi:hypothetical protein